MRSGVFIPGKVILAGEHAVVYGKPALAASLRLGVVVVAGEGNSSRENELVRKAITVAGGSEEIGVRIESELPVGAGLGSSAAVAAAIIQAVREYVGKPIGQDELFELTMKCERLAHGNPSGIDPATVVYGGLIVYTKGQPFERLAIKRPLKVLLVNTGKPQESTKEMVELVAKNPDKERLVEEIGELTKKIRQELIEGQEIGEFLDQNGRLLEELQVVGERARGLSRELRGMGAKVKITGAGGRGKGSGMMIALSPDLAKIKRWLDNKQITYLETKIGKV